MALEFPDIPIASSRFGLKRIQATFESPFSKKLTTLFHSGGKTDRWEGIYTTPALNLQEAQKLRVFLSELKGQVGTFKAFNPDRKQLSTYSPANLLADSISKTADTVVMTVDSDDFPGIGKVNGSGQMGRALNTDGWSQSAKVLKAGDFFQVQTQLYIATNDVLTDEFGEATILLEPAIRESPAHGSDIITVNPVMIARLTKPFIDIEIRSNFTLPVSLPFEEVL